MGEKIVAGSGRPIVTMVQPAESIMRKNATRSCGRNPAVRCSPPESEMGAIVVVVADIFGDQPSQMTFIQGNGKIKNLAADPNGNASRNC